MKKRVTYPIMALAIALTSCTPKSWVNPNINEINDTYKNIWSADKFSKEQGKHLYEEILSGIEIKKPVKPEKLSDQASDVWLLMQENRGSFLETGDRKYALKAMSYAQYLSVISPSRGNISEMYISDLENRLDSKD
jgi:hypothetical protein